MTIAADKTNATLTHGDHPAHHNELATAVNALTGATTGLYNAADPFYGISEAGTAAANKTAIDAFLADVFSDGGGVAIFPFTGEIKTNGAHDVPVGVRVEGINRIMPVFHNRGSTYCFRLMDETSGGAGGRLKHCGIIGSDGSNAAVNGGIGLELSNGLRHTVEDVYIYGFTGTGSRGLRFHNRNGTVEFVEQCHVENVMVVNCTGLIDFFSDTSAGTSFGYNQLLDVELQIYANQSAIIVGGGSIGSTLYNSRIIGQLHYTGNNGVGFDVASNGEVWQGTHLDIRGEMLSAYTGCKRINNAGAFVAEGKFFIANGQPADTPGSPYSFIQAKPTYVEFASINDLTIASASTIAIPSGVGGSEFFNVTGTTNITQINTGEYEGQRVTLKFAGILTVTDGGNLKLAGNFVTSADDTLTLVHRSGVWYEVCRSAN